MRIELPIQWKMQGVNMACLPACLAMLLSSRGHSDETWNVIERFRMPYRIRAIPSEDRVVAGTGFEFDEWTRLYCMKEYGCELISERIEPERYLRRVDELIREGDPVVMSVQRASGGHAVVAYGIDSGGLYLLDPDDGVRMRRPERVDAYSRRTEERVTGSELLQRLRCGTDGNCVLGRLIESGSDGRVLPCDRDWIEGNGSRDAEPEGIEALRWIGRRINVLKEQLGRERDLVHSREMFYEVGTNCVAPLVRHLFGAVVASGIVHYGDAVRVRIYVEVLEELERLFQWFMDGLNRSRNGEPIGDGVWCGLAGSMDGLTGRLSALHRG